MRFTRGFGTRAASVLTVVNATATRRGEHRPMRNLAATSDADVLIVGGGPAGLALACALDNAGLSSTVIERQSLEAIRSSAEDGRDIALTHRARGQAASNSGRGAVATAESEPHAGYDGRNVLTLKFDNGFAGDPLARRISDRRLLVARMARDAPKQRPRLSN